MKKILSVVVAASVFLSGCSLLVPHSQDFSARCSEGDAELFINKDKFQGAGSTRVARNKTVSVMCTKGGFKPASRTVDPTLSGAGIADAIGTIILLVPGFGFLSPGAWKIKEDNVNVTMERDASPGH